MQISLKCTTSNGPNSTKHIKPHFLTLSKIAKDQRKSNMILVINTLRKDLHLKVTKVAQIYNVPYKTLKA